MSDGVVKLDAFSPADAAAHLAAEDDEHARRFGWWPARSTAESVARAFERWERDWALDGPTRAFAARVDDELVGGCELRVLESGIWALSYWVRPDSRGKGHATRIAALATEYAHASLGAEAVELHVEPDNLASKRVAEKNAFVLVGDKTEKTDAGETRTMLVYRRGRA